MRVWLLLTTALSLVLAGCYALNSVHNDGVAALGTPPPPYRNLQNPFAPDDQVALARGALLYERNCFTCHGPQGRGDGPRAPFLEPAPADYRARTVRINLAQDPGFVFWVVTEGIPYTAMPPFARALSETERWQVITYERYLSTLRDER